MLYWDEELQEWVADDTAEIPLPPKEELKYRNEPPSPPSLGLGGKYTMGKLPNDYVPEERPRGLSMPSMLAPKDYEAGIDPSAPVRHSFLIGYGDRTMRKEAPYSDEAFDENYRTAPGDWKLGGGGSPSPKYVEDVLGTIDARDSGEMSETQLGEKIKANEFGGRIPPRPDPTKLSLSEYFRSQGEEIAGRVKARVEEAGKLFDSQFATTDKALLGPKEKFQMEKDKADHLTRAWQDALTTEKEVVKQDWLKIRAEEEKKANPPSKTEEQLIHTMNFDPDPKKRNEAKVVYETMQDSKKKIAEASRNLPQQTQFTDPETGRPLIFDKATGTYKVAPVEGGGGIAPRPVNPSAGEREKTASFGAIQEQMKKIQSIYEANKDYVGVVSGQVGRVSQLWDAGEAGFRRDIADMKDTLMRARSGAQINEKEYARLSALVPSPGDSDTMFEGKMKAFNDYLEVTIKHRTEAQKKGGVKLKGEGSIGGKSTPTRAELEAEARRRGLIK